MIIRVSNIVVAAYVIDCTEYHFLFLVCIAYFPIHWRQLRLPKQTGNFLLTNSRGIEEWIFLDSLKNFKRHIVITIPWYQSLLVTAVPIQMYNKLAYLLATPHSPNFKLWALILFDCPKGAYSTAVNKTLWHGPVSKLVATSTKLATLQSNEAGECSLAASKVH